LLQLYEGIDPGQTTIEADALTTATPACRLGIGLNDIEGTVKSGAMRCRAHSYYKTVCGRNDSEEKIS